MNISNLDFKTLIIKEILNERYFIQFNSIPVEYYINTSMMT